MVRAATGAEQAPPNQRLQECVACQRFEQVMSQMRNDDVDVVNLVL